MANLRKNIYRLDDGDWEVTKDLPPEAFYTRTMRAALKKAKKFGNGTIINFGRVKRGSRIQWIKAWEYIGE